MREITTHKIINGLSEAIKVLAVDEPGPGGANHHYVLTFGSNPLRRSLKLPVPCDIQFQNGPLLDAGENGYTNEALLAVLIDRMQGFQGGQFACRENAIALTHLQDAMHWLQHRTRERMARGVEGTLQK